MKFWWLGPSFAVLLIFTFTTDARVDEQTSTDKCLFPRIPQGFTSGLDLVACYESFGCWAQSLNEQQQLSIR